MVPFYVKDHDSENILLDSLTCPPLIYLNGIEGDVLACKVTPFLTLQGTLLNFDIGELRISEPNSLDVFEVASK